MHCGRRRWKSRQMLSVQGRGRRASRSNERVRDLNVMALERSGVTTRLPCLNPHAISWPSIQASLAINDLDSPGAWVVEPSRMIWPDRDTHSPQPLPSRGTWPRQLLRLAGLLTMSPAASPKAVGAGIILESELISIRPAVNDAHCNPRCSTIAGAEERCVIECAPMNWQ